MKDLEVVILAGGMGTRMNKGKPSLIPKALIKLADKPMVSYIIETLKKIGMDKPVLVVSKKEPFEKMFGDKCRYVIQKEPLGTGHAAKLGIKQLCAKDILILQGDDSAFYKSKTLKKFLQKHQQEKAILSFLTAKIPNPTGYGRIIRNKKGLAGIAERENLNKEQQKIKEINCGGYLINLAWIKENIKKIGRHYKGGKEYPLPDIIKIALSQGVKVIAFPIVSSEWFGINSPEQLREAHKLIKES